MAKCTGGGNWSFNGAFAATDTVSVTVYEQGKAPSYPVSAITSFYDYDLEVLAVTSPIGMGIEPKAYPIRARVQNNGRMPVSGAKYKVVINDTITFSAIKYFVTTLQTGDTATVSFSTSSIITFVPNEYCFKVIAIKDSLINGAGNYVPDQFNANDTAYACGSFCIPSSTISSSAGTGGNISPVGDSIVGCYSQVSYTFQANTGYQISQVLIDGVNNPAAVSAGKYTFMYIQENHSIQVVTDCIPMTITKQPVGSSICAGESYTFKIGTEGYNLTYQWYLNGKPIEGAIADSLTITSIQSDHQGKYTVSVSNKCMTWVSESALLVLATPLPSELEFIQIPEIVYPNENYRVIVGRTLGFYSHVSCYDWSFSNDKLTISPESVSSPNAWLQTGAIPESGILTVNLTHMCGEERSLSRLITFKYPTRIDNLGRRS